MKYYGKSIKGNYRLNNEDSLLIHGDEAPYYAIIADGMGGAVAGEIASSLVTENISSYLKDSGSSSLNADVIKKSVAFANDAILDTINKNPSFYGMGSTLTFAYSTENSISIAHVGDSSAFLYSNKKLTKITKDHSYVQSLIDTGKYTPEDAGKTKYKNFITKAMGMKNLEADYYNVEWTLGDRLIIFSDGLTGVVNHDEILNVLINNDSLEEITNILVDLAVEHNSKDNISVVICENTIGKDTLISDRYLLSEEIAEGGFSNIFVATDTKEHKKVVLKILKNKFHQDYKVVRAFKKEALISLSLRNKNIVKISDYGQHKTAHYIVMDYVEGVTLKDLLNQNKKIPLDEIVNIFKCLCLALEYAHSKGVTHGDIKPENIMINQNYEPCIMDFGVAGHLDVNKDSKSGEFFGSVHYISPEQAKSNKIDRRSDIYSLGIVLYEMITGHVPFDGESSIEIALKHINLNITDIDQEISSQIPQSIRNIIYKATEKDRQKRYHSALLMYHDLQKCFDHPGGEYIKYDIPRKKQQLPDNNHQSLFFRHKKFLFTIIVIAGLTAAILIMFSVFSNYIGIINGYSTTVPNVVNMAVEDAEYAIVSNELKIDIKYEYDSSVPADTVIKQYPEHEYSIEKGAVVTITVSLGPEDGNG